MARKNKTLRGFGFMSEDYGTSSLTTDSVYTENTPRPGSSTTHADTTRGRLVPQILGTQSKPVSFLGTRAGGFPDLGGLGAGVGYYFPDDGETAADLRSWRPPTLITDARNFGTGQRSVYALAASSRASGMALVNFPDDSSGQPTYAYNPYTNAWTTNGAGPYANGAFEFVPHTESILWVSEDGEASISHDYGASWNTYGSFGTMVATDESWDFDGDIRRLKFDAFGSAVFLGNRDNADQIDFWVSGDLGLTWSLSASLDAKKADIASHPAGGLVLAWIDAGDDINVTLMGSANDNPSVLPATELGNTVAYTGPIAYVDDDGVIYVHARTVSDPNNTAYWVSDDLGITWNRGGTPYTDNAAVWGGDSMGTSPDYTTGLQMVSCAGRALVAAGSNGTASSAFYSSVFFLGGWQGPMFERDATDFLVADPPKDLHRRLSARFEGGGPSLDLAFTWIPSALPNTLNGSAWTAIAAGTNSSTIEQGGARLTTGTLLSNNIYEFQLAGASNAGTGKPGAGWARWGVDMTSVANNGVHFSIETDQAYVRIECASSSFRLYDVNAAAALGASVDYTAGAKLHFEILVEDSNGAVTLLWTEEVADSPFPTKWSKVTRTATFTGTAGANTLNYRMGIQQDIADAVMCYAQGVGIFRDVLPAPTVLEGTAGWGKSVGSQWSYPIPDLGDATNKRQSRMVLRGGPVGRGQRFDHDVAPDYPWELIFPTHDSSPERTWRSVDKTADVQFEMQLATQDSLLAGSPSWAFLVRNCNTRRILVEEKVDGGSYATLGTIDLADGFTTVGYGLRGRELRPGSGSTGARYIAPGELRCGHVILDPAGTPKLRRIISNTGGHWDSTADVQPTLTLSGVDGTEATSGDCHVVWPSGVLVVHQSLAAAPTRHVRFTIDVSADDAPESFYEIGTLVPLGIRLPGKQWSDGYEWTKTPNVRGDVDSARVESRTSRGATQRSLALGWDDGFKLSTARATGADYLGPSGGAALQTWHEVQGEIFEWLELTDGTARPCLALGNIPDAGGMITDPLLFLFGYLSPRRVRATQGRGDEGVDEFMRADGITLTEAV